jgi:branched-chain amino acid transport system permease protein
VLFHSSKVLVRRPWLALASGLALAAVLQLCRGLIDPSWAHLINVMAINVVLAVSLNLVIGETGQFSLCHAAFMAVGAYASSLLTLRVLPGLLPQGSWTGTSWASQLTFLPVLTLGGAAAAAAGLVVGGPSLRLRGDYLAMVTLGFGEIIRVLLQNTEAVGGARGLANIPPVTNLFWAVGMAVLTLYTMTVLGRSTYGRGFHAVRDDEIAAAAIGIDTTRVKVTAFVVGAFFAGVAGGLFAHEVEFISPGGFGFLSSFEIIVMVILGGLGRPVGVAVAAVLVTLVNDQLRDLSEYRMVVYSLLLILFMIFRPVDSLGPLLRRLLPPRRPAP